MEEWKNKVLDKLFDLCPVWLYRAYDSVKSFPKNVKWKIQRANGKLPACDCWDFDLTLADVIVQGLKYLLEKGDRNWDWGDERDRKKELERVLAFFEEYVENNGRISVERLLNENGNDWIVRANKEEREYLKECEECMRLLGKNMWILWD